MGSRGGILLCLLVTSFILLCFSPLNSATATLVLGHGPFRDSNFWKYMQIFIIYITLAFFEAIYDDQGTYNTHDDEADIVKRSAFGLLGLATKRPHKIEAE